MIDVSDNKKEIITMIYHAPCVNQGKDEKCEQTFKKILGSEQVFCGSCKHRMKMERLNK